MGRTKGAKDKKQRILRESSSPERMRKLADLRRLPEKQCTIRVLDSARSALRSIPRKDRTLFATKAIKEAVDGRRMGQ